MNEQLHPHIRMWDGIFRGHFSKPQFVEVRRMKPSHLLILVEILEKQKVIWSMLFEVHFKHVYICCKILPKFYNHIVRSFFDKGAKIIYWRYETGNIFLITCFLWGKSIVDWWISVTGGQYLICCQPDQTIERSWSDTPWCSWTTVVINYKHYWGMAFNAWYLDTISLCMALTVDWFWWSLAYKIIPMFKLLALIVTKVHVYHSYTVLKLTLHRCR